VWQPTDAAPLLQLLHWLPVKHRITYKTLLLIQKVMTTSMPSCLSEVVETVVVQQLPVPRTRTKHVLRDFSVVTPSV